MDARDLVLKEDIRNYWKENGIFTDPESQIKLLMRAYAPIEVKSTYLESFEKDGILKDISNHFIEIMRDAFSRDHRYEGSNYLKIYQIEWYETSALDNTSKKYDFFNNEYIGVDPNIYLSLEECLENTYANNFIIIESILDINNQKKFVDHNIYYYIEGNKIALRLGLEKDYNYQSKYFDSFYNSHCQSNSPETPLYPFNIGDRLKLQTNDMDDPIIGTYSYEIDGFGTNYIFLNDHINGRDEEYWIATSRFQKFFNIYDWIEKEEQ